MVELGLLALLLIGLASASEAQVAAAALRDHRWVTLVGTGGIGKTRLAAELARRWLRDHPHAVVQTCALAHVGTEGSFLAAVAAALGLDPTGDPANRIGPALARLPPDALVVLDTFEQLLGCRPWLEAWLSAAPVRFLVTSRERLGGRDERWVVLAPLDPARSAALYRAYAPGDHADPDVAAVVARLDGLPLAIELAAARADQIPPREMAARLARPLDLLVRRSPTAYSGHSTLRGAFDGSWDLLSPPERQVWTGCAVFASPWTAADAAAVTGVADAEPHLVRLAARSLMIRDHERWSMLDTLRGYADEKRVLGGGDALDRHAAVFAALADNPSGQAGYGGPGMDRIRSALPELVAVVHRASDPRHRGAALRAIVMHGWYDHTLARIRDAVAGVGTRGVDPPNEAVLDAARALIEPERADAWLTAAAAAAVDPGARRLVDGITAYRLFQRGEVAEAAAVAQALLDPTSLRTLAESGSEYAQYAVQLAPDGAAAVERARGHAERLGDPRVLASVLRERSVAASLAGSFDDAISFADRAIAAAASAGWAFGRAGGLAERIGAEVRSGRLLAALQSLAELERLDVEPGAEPRLVGLLWGAGVSAELGDLDGARARFDSAEVRGDLDPQWRIGRAYVERLAGRPALALDGLGGATAWSIAGGSAWACAAGAAAELGRLDQADAWLAQALSAPHADRFAATAHLVAVARARLDGDLAAAERAARAFVDRQPLVTCDDGRLRVRPMLASFQHELLRALLDRAGR
ncbi:MAG: hypothetical protein ABMB14_23770 [Myxococcota bacterium]